MTLTDLDESFAQFKINIKRQQLSNQKLKFTLKFLLELQTASFALLCFQLGFERYRLQQKRYLSLDSYIDYHFALHCKECTYYCRYLSKPATLPFTLTSHIALNETDKVTYYFKSSQSNSEDKQQIFSYYMKYLSRILYIDMHY